MRGKAGIVARRAPARLRKRFGDESPRLIVLAHPERIGLEPAPEQPRLHRMQHGTMPPRIFPDRLDELARPRDDSGGHIAMAVEILGGEVHGEIDAEGERKLVEA